MRTGIDNAYPLIGNYDVNDPNNGDIYSKGSNMLHTLRQLLGDDEKWRDILRGINKDFYHQTVSSKQLELYLINKTGLKLSSFFDQYLRDARMPILQYKIDVKNGRKLSFCWTDCIEDFDMPIKIKYNNKVIFIYPKSKWSSINLEEECKDIIISKEYYVGIKRMD